MVDVAVVVCKICPIHVGIRVVLLLLIIIVVILTRIVDCRAVVVVQFAACTNISQYFLLSERQGSRRPSINDGSTDKVQCMCPNVPVVVQMAPLLSSGSELELTKRMGNELR